VVLPVHKDCDEGVAVATGFGLTVIVTGIVPPTHDPTAGVIVYVAVPAEVPVAVKFCAMVAPLLGVAPVTPNWLAVHVKVVPDTLLVSAMDVASPEQMVCVDGTAVATGRGFTVTVAVIGEPVQLTVEGVIV
jgi:hypothetical protein